MSKATGKEDTASSLKLGHAGHSGTAEPVDMQETPTMRKIKGEPGNVHKSN